MKKPIYNLLKGKIIDEHYDELLPLSPPARAARILRYTLLDTPIWLEDEPIAGRYGYIDEGEELSYTERALPFPNSLSEEERLVKAEFLEKFRIDARHDKGHFTADYENILKIGLSGYENKVKSALSGEGISVEKSELLSAMLDSVSAVRAYTERFVSLAKETEGGEWREKIIASLTRAPYLPARNIHEAISAIFIMHSALAMADDSWASISLGRLDKILYPYYESSLSEGESRESVKEYLGCFFRLINSYGDGAQALNVGGLSAEGVDETNELTYLIIEVEKEIALAAPILAVRVHGKTPDRLLDEAVDGGLFSIGQPTFYSELACRQALRERGVPAEDAHRFVANSCMGIYMCGEEIASMWGCVFNMHLPLELALSGEPLAHKLPISISAHRVPTTLDELYAEYGKYLEELLSYFFIINRKNAENRAASTANPLLSMLTEGCIARGLDRALGAKYNTETVETMALVNTANAIHAIDTLVFKKKKYSLSEIVSAARADFVGYEKILADIRRCDKYGKNIPAADAVVRRLVEMTAGICKRHSRDNVYFLPSLHTLDLNVGFGRGLYTTLDGRMAGEPVAKNAGPTNDTRSPEPTGLILSATSIRQELFSGGQPIDLYFDRAMTESEEGREAIKTLIRTYASRGGMQLQVNGVDIALLEAALEHPERYPDLIVRLGGYSTRFADLPTLTKREFIERFKRESAK